MDQNPNELLGMKSLAEAREKGVVDLVKHNLGSAWYFDKFYEKMILVGLSILGMWKLMGFIF